MDLVPECKESRVDLVDLSIFIIVSSRIWGIGILVALVGLNSMYTNRGIDLGRCSHSTPTHAFNSSNDREHSHSDDMGASSLTPVIGPTFRGSLFQSARI